MKNIKSFSDFNINEEFTQSCVHCGDKMRLDKSMEPCCKKKSCRTKESKKRERSFPIARGKATDY